MSSRFLRGSMAATSVILCFGVLTTWVPERWALSAYQAGIFALALAWAGRMIRRPYRLRWSPTLLVAGMPAAWGLFQLAAGATAYRWATWNSVLNGAAAWTLFAACFQFGADTAVRSRFLKVLLHFGFALSVVATIQMFTSDGKFFWLFPSGYSDYVLGPFVYRNQYAAFIEMILPLALYQAFRRPEHAFRYWLMASIMVASVVAGASRAGSVLVTAEVIVILFVAWGRGAARGAVGWGAAQFLLLGLVFTAVVGWDVLWERFQSADPYAVRRELLVSSVEMVQAKPTAGFGMGTWSTVYPSYALYDDGLFANQAHNDWAQWAVEGGLPLLAGMLAFGGLLVVPAWRALWGLGLISVLLHCFVDYPMQRPALAGWFFAIAGLLAGLAASGGATEKKTAGA